MRRFFGGWRNWRLRWRKHPLRRQLTPWRWDVDDQLDDLLSKFRTFQDTTIQAVSGKLNSFELLVDAINDKIKLMEERLLSRCDTLNSKLNEATLHKNKVEQLDQAIGRTLGYSSLKSQLDRLERRVEKVEERGKPVPATPSENLAMSNNLVDIRKQIGDIRTRLDKMDPPIQGTIPISPPIEVDKPDDPQEQFPHNTPEDDVCYTATAPPSSDKHVPYSVSDCPPACLPDGRYAAQIQPGIYRIKWTDDTESTGVVHLDTEGLRKLSCTNWKAGGASLSEYLGQMKTMVLTGV